MRIFAFIVPFAAAAVLSGAAAAQPATVNVTLGAALQNRTEELGSREVQAQVDQLSEAVASALADNDALEGARIDLVLTELKPNRPTFRQTVDRPGLDPIRSISIGGAAIEGQITLADGTVQPVRYNWFSNNLAEVNGFSVWRDAERAYRRFGANLAAGRYVSR